MMESGYSNKYCFPIVSSDIEIEWMNEWVNMGGRDGERVKSVFEFGANNSNSINKVERIFVGHPHNSLFFWYVPKCSHTTMLINHRL